VEAESRRKDEVIAVLRRELTEYKKAMQTHDARYVFTTFHYFNFLD